jgi:UDP:flavonoid glycosyltransferase YjiC (YdhE family)
MSTVLIASTPLLGHVAPMLMVADFLREKGHRVLFLTSEVFRQKVEACGVRFLTLAGTANYDYRQLNTLFTGQEAAAVGLEAHIVHLKRLFADQIPDQYLGLSRVINREKIDLILTDVLFMGNIPLLLEPRGIRPPIVACGVIAPMWRDPGFSPFNGPDSTPEGQRRNLEDHQQFDTAVMPGTTYIDQVLEGLGCAIPGGFRMFDSLYRLPDQFLQFCAADFEYPLIEKRRNLRFVGPILPRSSKSASPLESFKGLDLSKAVVVVTQGTLANTDFDQLINPTILGLADEDVQVVATAGGNDTATIAQAPNAMVKAYVPYDLVLSKARVFVTNGGYNGVQQALSFGVPIVSAGASEDKPQVSARVAWSGVGIDLKTGNPTPTQIRQAVQEIIRNPSYRAQAERLGASITGTTALETIAEIVELGGLGFE